jgi:2-polyprenyl-3-methyl-5-hydroxy-6-metoxy-1,4-benzoquinol methylase/uncharacterized membrane protein YbhN (UPF0104 family)
VRKGSIALARSLAPVLLTILLLSILFRLVNVSDVLRQMERINTAHFVAAIIMMLLSTVLSTLRYRGVLWAYRHGESVPFLPLLQLNLLTLFSAHFLPIAALADGMRALVSRRLLGISVAAAFESVVADRGLAALGLAALGLFVLPMQLAWGWPWEMVTVQFLAFAGLMAFVAVGSVAAFLMPGPLGPFAGMGRRFVEHFARVRGLLFQLLLSAGTMLLFAGMLYVLADGLGVPISLAVAVAIAPAVYLSQVVPIFYAGFGSREVVLAAILVPSGILTDSAALALALVVGLCNLSASLPGALFVWPLLRNTSSRPGAPLSSGQKRAAFFEKKWGQYMKTPINRAVDGKTIADFGEQWTHYTDNSGYYGSAELLSDFCEPLLAFDRLSGMTVADIGSGTGRIVNMLLDAGAAHVTAIEPSDAFAALAANTLSRADQVHLVRGEGTAIPQDRRFDLVISLGVLHHVVDPSSIVQASSAALKPGGQMFVWLYGREGNEAYLAIFGPLRAITKRLPHRLLAGLCHALDPVAMGYAAISRAMPLPMRDYMQAVYAKLAPDKRRLVIYDQLNPTYAKYYREAEARRLLEDNGFVNVRTHHRHGYSWSVIGDRG